jgi:DNA-binding MarR family transcriptional regulator
MGREEKARSARQAMEGIDRVIHEPARLLIVAHLYVIAEADFIFLERQTGLTRGNLSSHLRRLEEAGYIEVRKEFADRMPRTILRLTESGRESFDSYRKKIRVILD